MSIPECPRCKKQTPNVLTPPAELKHLVFYWCTACGHIWNVNRLNPGVVTHITPLPDDKQR